MSESFEYKVKNLIDSMKLSVVVPKVIMNDNKCFITIELSANLRDQIGFLEEKILSKLQNLQQLHEYKIIWTMHNEIGAKSKILMQNIRKIILVSSGKGGVGKSTITCAIANYYAHLGQKVGILDADISGPSVPLIYNIKHRALLEDNKFIPYEHNGIKIMSSGFIVDEGAALAWRGPMISKLLYQMLSNTDWRSLDILLIDMPPGTGDTYLSIIENYYVNSAIVVTTPSPLSLIDTKRTINLLNKFNIQIEYLIKNMVDIFPGYSNLADLLDNHSKAIQVNYDKKFNSLHDISNHISL